MMESARYIHQFTAADYYVIGAYLLMLVSVGFIVKKLCGNVKDYFIGGNKIPWWLAAGSCFMMSFSAWTFTGAAGFAYNNGIRICMMFYYNIAGYIFMGLFLAAKCRQTRQITFPQIIYQRFGRLGEQVFLWIQVPNMMFCGAIWLVGLATFISAAFGVPIMATILVTGTVILIYSTISGSWAVMTTDFLQSIILMTLTVVVFVLTLGKIGGIEGFMSKVDPSKLQLFNEEHSGFWQLAYFAQTFMVFTSVLNAPRYLAVGDGKSARKVAFLTGGLFLIGPIMWFVPPIAASYFFPNIAETFPHLQHPQDAAYVLMGLNVLPNGLAGLLLMVVFAATLSSMDSGVNQNAAIITLNLYKPLFRPNASEREMFIASRVFNLVCGLLIMTAAIFLSMQKEMALFDLLFFLTATMVLPIMIPCFMIYWNIKTPLWSATVVLLLGLAYSIITYVTDCSFPVRVFGTMIVGFGSYFLCTLFWKYASAPDKRKVEDFYTTINTPIDKEKENIGKENVSHLFVVGTLTMIIGAGLFVVVFFPNDLRGRMIITATSVAIFLCGLGMYALGKKSINRSINE